MLQRLVCIVYVAVCIYVCVCCRCEAVCVRMCKAACWREYVCMFRSCISVGAIWQACTGVDLRMQQFCMHLCVCECLHATAICRPAVLCVGTVGCMWLLGSAVRAQVAAAGHWTVLCVGAHESG